MRLIKLSPQDGDMQTRTAVIDFFTRYLHVPRSHGRFSLTRGKIARDKFAPGTFLLFSYLGECLFTAVATSEIQNHAEPADPAYPFFFEIAPTTIHRVPPNRQLNDLENKLRHRRLYPKNLSHSQAWPHLSPQ
jgi:hypothetical protein